MKLCPPTFIPCGVKLLPCGGAGANCGGPAGPGFPGTNALADIVKPAEFIFIFGAPDASPGAFVGLFEWPVGLNSVILPWPEG